jgi:hypothetical protein
MQLITAEVNTITLENKQMQAILSILQIDSGFNKCQWGNLCMLAKEGVTVPTVMRI